MNHKHDRLEKHIKQEVMKILSEKVIKDPRIPDIVTITKTSLSKDFHYCHLYFSVIGTDKEKKDAEFGLNSAKGFIQKLISERLYLKYVPKLTFKYDSQEEEAFKVDQILSKLSQDRDKRNNSSPTTES